MKFKSFLINESELYTKLVPLMREFNTLFKDYQMAVKELDKTKMDKVWKRLTDLQGRIEALRATHK